MVITRLHTRNAASIHVALVLQINRIIDRSQRKIVEHLGALDHQVLGTHGDIIVTRLQLLEGDNGLTTLTHREEIEHCRSLAGIIVQRAHGHLADKCQGALTAHHAVSDDVKRVIIGDKRPQVQSRHILDAVFLADAVDQLAIGTDTVPQGLDTGDEIGM